MSHSRNEAASLITKAAAGAGLPWALARDLAQAFNAINTPTDADWQSLMAVLNQPITAIKTKVSDQGLEVFDARIATAGPATLDWLVADLGSVTLYDLDAPALLSGYLDAGGAEYSLAFHRQHSGTSIIITRAGPADMGAQSALPRLEFPPEILDKLTSFAAKTFVPESDASRLSGAGAGLTDND